MKNHHLIQPTHRILVSFILGLLLLTQSGCASKNVNPPKPQTQTGYVDFITDDDELYWQVEEVDSSGKRTELFAEFGPLGERVLRLAIKPGHHRFRVTFMNHAILQPGIIEAEVADGMILPIEVTFINAGTTITENKEVRVGGTAYGRYGRGTKIRAGQATMYQIGLKANSSLPYQPKSQMPYPAAAPAQ